MMEDETFIAWINGQPGGADTVSNGTMAAIAVGSMDDLRAVYAKAIELGSTDEGEAGPGGDNFSAGYFHDLDGSKPSVFLAG